MRSKEECKWCMSTQDIIRKIRPDMPEEFKHRCSACHEQWDESHMDSDSCNKIIDLDVTLMHYNKLTCMYIRNDCKDKHGYV